MKAIDTHPRVRIYISLRILVDKSNEGFPLNPLVTWANGCVSVGGGLETPMLVWRPTARSAPRGRRAARARGVLVAPFYICTVLFPASIFIFSFFNFMCSNFYLQPFYSFWIFYLEILCHIYLQFFNLRIFCLGFFGSLTFSCTKILHHDFFLQNLSMSKYSSPNFYVF